MKLQYDNCPNCFGVLNQSGTCPACGFRIEELPVNPNVLPPFTFLNERYLLGRILGQGGFGVTYIAQDIQNGKVCAIKEYMPVEYAKRSEEGTSVVINETGSRQIYEHGKKRFLEEAQMLFMLKDNPTVVKILDFFSENNTAYLVMEYLDGINLKGAMNRNEGRIEPEYAKVILVTVASSMIEIHKKGILHRDISPENIFLLRTGEIKLIDFGSSRSYVSSQKKNGMSVLLKPGFAPPEQYDSHGEQGPWTDVYSLAATFYYAVSGQKLPDSLYRQRGMAHQGLAEIIPEISAQTSRVIDKALKLKVRDRYPDFKHFLDELDIQYAKEKQAEEMKSPKWNEPQAAYRNPTGQYTNTTVKYTQDIPKKPVIPESNREKQEQKPGAGTKKKRGFSFFRKKQEIPVVQILTGRKTGQKQEISRGEILKIGRSAQQCHLALNYEDSISRIHCLVKYSEKKGVFIIQDISNNGTYLENGERLIKNTSYELEAGSRFYLSSVENMLKVDLEVR